MTENDLKAQIKKSFPKAPIIKVIDTRGDGYHWRVEIKCASFAGLSIIESHKRVYAAIGPEYMNDIHALSLETAPG